LFTDVDRMQVCIFKITFLKKIILFYIRRENVKISNIYVLKKLYFHLFVEENHKVKAFY